MQNTEWLKRMGPGLLFAAAAVGVSHLVQSTRAGALYGLGMLVFILFGLASKYPTFRFGHQYASVTGVSLLEGFRRQGTWALVLYALVTILTMFTALATVSLVTAGLAKFAFGLTVSAEAVAGGLIALCSAIILLGRYHWLDIIIKALMVVLVIATFIATLMAVPLIDWSAPQTLLVMEFDPALLLFTATLIGWMPAPLDTAIWQSLWTLEKSRDLHSESNWQQASPDFHIGFVATGIIAVCFLVLGTAVLGGRGTDLASSATGFAIQLIGMYEQSLGSWSKSVISITALAVMLSTVLVVLDGYPRSIVVLVRRFRCAEAAAEYAPGQSSFALFAAAVIGLGIGAMCVLLFFMRSFATLIGIATTISFLAAPVLAWLVHRAMVSGDVPQAQRIGRGLELYSLLCIGLLTLFALGYMYLLVYF
jgi:Mn2+/Fe2+ NRAMP family transporter